MEKNDFITLLEKRRSVRKYSSRPVEEEKIERLLEAVMTSPTAMNLQSWRFAVVEDRNLLNQLSVMKPHGAGMLSTAPLAIVVMGDESVSPRWIEDTSIAATVLQLTGESLSLGSCWIQVRDAVYNDTTSSETYIRQLLGENDSMRVLCVLSIGYDADPRKPRPWPDASTKVRYY